MILIPELETVVILVPRTASGSLRRAIAERYPRSMLIYRHMEADGVPHGYDRWPKIGVLRHPTERLWSLYKFLRNFGGNHDPAYIESMRSSAQMEFSEWIVSNEIPFTSPYDSAGEGRFFPQFTVRHHIPENRKSQFFYLRPDLGTAIHRFERISDLALALDVSLCKTNETETDAVPELSVAASAHMAAWFRWDFEMIERTLP